MAKTCTGCAATIPNGKNRCVMCGSYNWENDIVENKVIKFSDIKEKATTYIHCGPWNGTLSAQGGLVAGFVYLLGGFPGGGKSTFCLQCLEHVGSGIYVSAEESAEDVRDRADRIGFSHHDYVDFYDALEDCSIGHLMQENWQGLIILDSLQALGNKNDDDTVTFLRLCKVWAQHSKSPVIIINHATKDDPLAGLQAFQHWVDCTLSLVAPIEGKPERVLTVHKNRKGPTVTLKLWMTEQGLSVTQHGTQRLQGVTPRLSQGRTRNPAKGGTE